MTDVLIIGAGHNGVVGANSLAREGNRVTIVEAAPRVGGAAVTREFASGFQASGCAHFSYMLDASIAKELDLASHGLRSAKESLRTVALAAEGEHLVLANGRVDAGRVSESDRAALAKFHADMLKFARVLGRQHSRRPPRLGAGGRSEMFAAALLGLDIRMLGRD